jgi:CDP-paratose 2-epimerase
MLQAIDACQRISGRELKWTYVDESRVGDHMWWISSVEKFRRHYPNWQYRYDLEGILRELHEAV